MTTIKSYTDLEQSKKLAEILPLKSVDMYYWCGEELRIGGYKAMDIDYDIPCWSLAALLNIISVYTLQTNIDGTVFIVFESSKKSIISNDCDNPVDACVDLIIKLKKENLL